MLIFPLKKEWYEKIKSGEKTYDKRFNKKEALRAFEQLNGARVIENNMRTGTEKIIKERVPA